MARGYFTAVFSYEDVAALRSDPLYDRIFDLMKLPLCSPLRVCGISAGNEMDRAERLERAIEKHGDADLQDEIAEIDNVVYASN